MERHDSAKETKMSGGFFDYKQYHISEIADSIQRVIDANDEPQWNYSQETIEEFKKGIEYLQKAAIYAQRIDWLLESDDSEKTFHERLTEELRKQ